MARLTSGLPHFSNSAAAVNNWEPLYLNQYEVIFTPPAVIGGVDLLLEQVKTVKGLPEITPTGIVTQKYKFAERVYANAAPEKTHAEFTIEFEVNLDDSNSMYTYNTLRQWANIHYNPNRGSQGLKRDYAGSIYVAISNKAQEIYRSFNFKTAFMMDPLNSMDLDYGSKDGIYSLTAKFVSDNWEELRNGAYDLSDII
jgi:hypothetical protein